MSRAALLSMRSPQDLNVFMYIVCFIFDKVSKYWLLCWYLDCTYISRLIMFQYDIVSNLVFLVKRASHVGNHADYHAYTMFSIVNNLLKGINKTVQTFHMRPLTYISRTKYG